MKIHNINKDKLFFTSDLHFYHERIIEFCSRPYSSIEEHDKTLIDNWNSVVPKDGIVFNAGDFIWTGQIDRIRSLVEKLNGKHYLCLGNHDYKNRLNRDIFRSIFEDVQDMYYLVIRDEEQSNGATNFQLCHYPLMYWNRGNYMLHGHVHSGPSSKSSEKVPFHHMRYDIGADNNNYLPISYSELMDKFEEMKIKAIEQL